jgi:hypothetical protein
VAEVYGFYDQSRLASAYGGVTASNYDLQYYGERVAGKIGMFAFEEEFIWQGGEASVGGKNKANAAFQLATRLGFATPNVKINAGLDMMSGDDDLTDDDMKTYRANYYFAHNLYGWMDYFVSNPQFGVMDIRLDGDFGFLPGPTGNPRLMLKPQYHYFLPQSAPSGMDDAYGQELNAEVHVAWFPKSNVVLGAGLFIPGDNAFRVQGERALPLFHAGVQLLNPEGRRDTLWNAAKPPPSSSPPRRGRGSSGPTRRRPPARARNGRPRACSAR